GIGRLGPDGRLDLATWDDDREVSRLGCRLERLRSQLAMQRPRTGESLDGRLERLEGRPECDRNVDERLEPVGGRELRGRACVADLADQVDEHGDVALRERVDLPHPWPA